MTTPGVKVRPGHAETTTVRTTPARCLAVAAVLLVAGAQAAAATPDADARAARAAADEASSRVDALTRQLDAELAARDEAMTALTSAVQQSITNEQAADDARSAAEDARGQHSRTVRALYRGGGELGLYSSLLGSTSVEDALSRTVMARRVLGFAAARSGQHATTADAALAASAESADVAETQVVTVADVIEATVRIEATLTEATQVLDSLSRNAAELEAAAEARRRLDEARARAAASSSTLSSSGTATGSAPSAAAIPSGYLALYQQAAQRCPGMRWTLLAAVGQVESRHGSNNGPSSAGAVGPMQFMPGTFARYGVDGDGDARADPWNPADAIHSAAVYLCVNGGGGDGAQVQRALLRYNNAQWYVDLVLGVEGAVVAAQQAG